MNILRLSVKFILMLHVILTKSSRILNAFNALMHPFSIDPKKYFYLTAKTRPLEKCYDDLGCVKLTPEWTHRRYRPVNKLPADRHAINTIFVYWRKQADKAIPEIMGTGTPTQYNFKRSCNILIHDFTSNGYTGWIQQLTKTLQSMDMSSRNNLDSEVVSVDWAPGAAPPYVQALANARLVALEIVAFLSKYRNYNLLCTNCVHLYGHGVGAHIAGYVGKLFPIRHITGLDPSGLFFKGMPRNVKLDSDDAQFVEVIHTHGMPGGQGIDEKLGHIDYYPNGGMKQPGCVDKILPLHRIKRGDLKLGATLPGCSHKRCLEYYIEALARPSCSFVGVACPSYKKFLQGCCNRFAENPTMCCSVKLQSPKNRVTMPHNLYFVTSNSAPFCAEMLLVSLSLTSPDPKHSLSKGQYKITIAQPKGNIVFMLNENSVIKNLNANERQDFLVFRTTPPTLEFPIQKINLQWRPSPICFVKSVLKPLIVDCFVIKKVADDIKQISSQTFVNKNTTKLKNVKIEPFYFEDTDKLLLSPEGQIMFV